ncbi:MAG: hypothetical protein ACK5NG_10780 [Chthoniobacterales bacterium]
MLPLSERGSRIYRPVQLDHIGLTNHPQIAGSNIGFNESNNPQQKSK